MLAQALLNTRPGSASRGRAKVVVMLLMAVLSFSGCSALTGLFASSADGSVADTPDGAFASQQQLPAGASSAELATLPEQAELDASLQSVPARNVGNVEIIWEIPKDPVDGFMIYYGYERGRLDREVRIEVKAVQRVQDPTHGEVFRHVLKDIENERVLFVSVAAFRGSELSTSTTVFEVAPGEKD